MENENVVSPAGMRVSDTMLSVQRLGNLDGKVIGEVWNGDFKGDVTFPMIRAQLLKRHPSLKIIPFTDFHIHMSATIPSGSASVQHKLRRSPNPWVVTP